MAKKTDTRQHLTDFRNGDCIWYREDGTPLEPHVQHSENCPCVLLDDLPQQSLEIQIARILQSDTY